MELADWPDFRGACLAGASFDGSYMMDGDFRGADLRGASFRRAYIKCSDFRGADVRGAMFVEAGLESTDFDGARYDGTEFLGGFCYGPIGPGDGFPGYGTEAADDGGGDEDACRGRRDLADRRHPETGRAARPAGRSGPVRSG